MTTFIPARPNAETASGASLRSGSENVNIPKKTVLVIAEDEEADDTDDNDEEGEISLVGCLVLHQYFILLLLLRSRSSGSAM